MQQTLMLIKPDGVKAGQIGEVIKRIEAEEFQIRGLKMLRLTRNTAGAFYRVHKEKGFFQDLLEFMTSERIVALALERDDAVAHLRKVIGATDPAEAAEGTVRKDLASSKQENVVHGSDSLENAVIELSFFFSREELLSINPV